MSHILQETKKLLKLAIPITASELILALLPFINTSIVAHINNESLAASSLAGTFYFAILGICIGVLGAISVSVSHAYGAKDHADIKKYARQGFILATLLAIPAMLLFWFIKPMLLALGQKPEVSAIAQPFLHSFIPSVLPDLLLMALQQFAMGISRPRLILHLNLILVPLSVFLSYALVFGKFGLPNLGMVGIGYGASISFWLVFLLGMLYISLDPITKRYRIFEFSKYKIQWNVLKELWHLGWPMGTLFALEIWGFSIATFMIGHLSIIDLVAHQIVIQFLGIIVMVYFGVAQASLVRIGQSIGAKKPKDARLAGVIGMSTTFTLMLLVACVYWFFPTEIIRIDINPADPKNAQIVKLAITLLFFTAIFQLMDGVRIVMASGLRGLKETKSPVVISFIGYWCCGLPLAYFLGFHMHYGVVGIWTALTVGVLISLILITWKFFSRVNQIIYTATI